MRVLLIRPGYQNLLDHLNLICVEPLELEYLSAFFKDMGHEVTIYDGQVMTTDFKKFILQLSPDIAAITGYITMKDSMLRLASIIKAVNNKTVVLVGGVHAELNYMDFFNPSVDFIIHSGSIKTLGKILHTGFDKYDTLNISGICYRDQKGNWITNDRASIDPNCLPLPDREHFKKYKKYFKYLNYSPCAVVKTAYGCPHQCSFCYCCRLNNGQYLARTLDSVIKEIKDLDAPYIWIVDDTFLINRGKIIEFSQKITDNNINKQFIIYSRADFICNNEDILPLLKSIGVVEVIVGLEAVDDCKLADFNKGVTADINRNCVSLLNKFQINFTGLFMVDIDADRRAFTCMSKWIRLNKVHKFTVSIYTPFPGTKDFIKYESRLLTRDYTKWDLLHLVLEPLYMSRFKFYLRFYLLYGNILLMGKKPSRSRINKKNSQNRLGE